MSRPIRWGFMGCGNIANNFATAMQLLPKSEHEIVAVAARDLTKAKEFADQFHAKQAFGGYENIASCPNVDIVYVAVISSAHFHCVKLALNAGKSVLCETPLGMNAGQVREMIRLARQKGVFFMEAFWSRCCPIYEEIRQALKDGRIGEPKFFQGVQGIETYETLSATPYVSENGCMLDFGSYLIMLTTMLFDSQRPESIQATGMLDTQGIDVMICVTLKYKNDAIVQLMISGEVLTEQRVILFGTKGSLELPEMFFCPSKVIVNSKLIERPLPDTKGAEFSYPNCQGLSYEIEHVRDCLLKGLKESPLMPLEHTDVVASIVDEIRRQVGVAQADLLL